MKPMKEPNEPTPPIDAVVRSYLELQAQQVDSAAILAKVRHQRQRHVSATSPKRWPRYLGAGLAVAIAACIVVVIFIAGGNIGPTPRMASAEELLSAAKVAHEQTNLDLAYDVQADWELPLFQRWFPFRPITRQAKLWTRESTFFVESQFDDGGIWKWGQEESGRVWIAPNRKRVLVYEPDEVGEPLAKFCNLMSLRAGNTLAEMLEKFDLFRKDSGQPGEPIQIEATLRRWFLRSTVPFHRIELTLHPDTKVIQYAKIERLLNGDQIGVITFTLLEQRQLTNQEYELNSHVDAKAVRLDGKRPQTAPLQSDLRSRWFREEFQQRFPRILRDKR